MKVQKFFQHKVFSFKLVLLILISLILSISIYFFSQNFLEFKAYDLMTKLSLSDSASKDIVNIVIDTDSLQNVGRWPWKRTLYTDMFEFFENYSGAKNIVFDAKITSYSNDKKSDKEFFARLNKLKKVYMGVLFNKKVSNQNEIFASIFKEKHSLNIEDLRDLKLIKNSRIVVNLTKLINFI